MSNPLQAIKQRFGIIGVSPQLDAALDTATRVAPTELTVLITGESGVGKEAFSKIIHALSIRKHNPFIAINCGAIPEGTINSELFGHEKGAFTGAVGDRKGYFETVNGGTIFLDEIGELPLDTQAMLLRILENGEYVRVGSSKVEKTNVRVIAATNVHLQEAVQKGKFREDLFYRLSTVPIRVPSLKERTEDIFMLFRKFCVDFAEKYRSPSIQLDDKARLILERYNWPGNIRELKNVAEQLSALSAERLITGDDLLDRMPHLLYRSLPMTRPQKEAESDNFSERDIMYKLLFDMKNDLNYLKTVIAELIKNNNLSVPNSFNFNTLGLPSAGQTSGRDNGLTPPLYPMFSGENTTNYLPPTTDYYEDNTPVSDFTRPSQPPIQSNTGQPIIIQKTASGGHNPFESQAEVVDESLDMATHEKVLILKALKKHANRRKDAADDLGISERTLYRKIKEYNLE
jgi:transcriptional regulator with PAS, ATPase and Fis domain